MTLAAKTERESAYLRG